MKILGINLPDPPRPLVKCSHCNNLTAVALEGKCPWCYLWELDD